MKTEITKTYIVGDVELREAISEYLSKKTSSSVSAKDVMIDAHLENLVYLDRDTHIEYSATYIQNSDHGDDYE